MPDHPLARLVTAQPLALLRAWAPLLIVVALCIAACFGLRRFFAQRIASGNSTRYQQQGIMALAGLFLRTSKSRPKTAISPRCPT
jgi:hypothetical protein